MAVTISVDQSATIEVDELVQFLIENKINPSDDDALISAAPMLKALYNNRSFLVKRISEDVKNYHHLADNKNYAPTTMVLHAHKSQPFFLRACMWLPEKQHRALKTNLDTYFQPHDHNFNFLTVGYFGPGYESNYFEYDYEKVAGYPGEPVSMTFVEKTHLDSGKIIFYRALRDVHDQFPPESLSVSINILETSLRTRVADQYAFDMPASTVSRFVNRVGAEPLLLTMACCGTHEDREVIRTIAARHASPRIRFYALKSLAHSAGTAEETIHLLSSVPAGAPTLLREWARVHLAQIEASLEP